ncbi:MAG: ATP-dependent DNA helicase RecG [Candidatus Omnitrophota bacterium]
MVDPSTPVRYLKGVGPKKSEIFAKMGVHTIFDLLYYFPRRYEDRKKTVKIAETVPGQNATIRAEVLTSGLKDGFRGKRIFTVGLSDDTGVLFATFFNQSYLQDIFKPGQTVLVSGRIEVYQAGKQMVHPAFEIIGEHKASLETGRIVSLYRLPEGLSQRSFHLVLWEALKDNRGRFEDIVPFTVRNEMNLGNQYYALKNIHFPVTPTDLKKAREYLIFEEFFFLSSALRHRRLERQKNQILKSDERETEPFQKIEFQDFLAKFQGLLDFPLTDSQRSALKEIVADLRKDYPMQRLLTGEVGSGKTLVAAGAIFYMVLSGGQSAFLAPTEILAEQHFLNLQRIFARAGREVALLVSGISRQEKEAVKTGVAEGRISIVIGTHSLLSEDLIFPSLSLAIIDEEHKFGVNQREVLGEKGKGVHLLLMSATPIPRTLALTLYGEIELSSLSPRGKRRVATYLFRKEEREVAYRLFDRYLVQGKKGYVVSSRLKGTAEDVVGAKPLFEEVTAKFPHWQPALIYGGLPLKEKERVIAGFREGKYQVLVATSVVEVGIDLPEANLLLIEDAERFGLAQLHQIRGRIGRQFEEALCLVVSEFQNDRAVERLEIFASTSEGQELAEDDLVLRGEGEVLGERQHGLPSLRLANLRRDLDLLQSGRKTAWEILDVDPGLELHPELRQRLMMQNLW